MWVRMPGMPRRLPRSVTFNSSFRKIRSRVSLRPTTMSVVENGEVGGATEPAAALTAIGPLLVTGVLLGADGGLAGATVAASGAAVPGDRSVATDCSVVAD